MPSNAYLPPDLTRCAKCHGPFTEKHPPQSPFPNGERCHAVGQCLYYCTFCGWRSEPHTCPYGPTMQSLAVSPDGVGLMLERQTDQILRAVAAMLVNQERRLRLTQDLSMMQAETEEEYAARLLDAGRKALEEPTAPR